MDSTIQYPDFIAEFAGLITCLSEWISADLADRLRRDAGFRKIAVHAYEKIDLALVFQVYETKLDDFGAFASAVVG